MKVKFKKINSQAVKPEKAKDGDICYDLFAIADYAIPSHSVVSVGTGIAIEPEYGYGIEIRSRSGLALSGVKCVGGEVDNGYRGEIKVLLENITDKPYEVKKWNKVAQCKPVLIENIEWEEVDEISSSSRGMNGFGHSGK